MQQGPTLPIPLIGMERGYLKDNITRLKLKMTSPWQQITED